MLMVVLPAQQLVLTKISSQVFTLTDLYTGEPIDGSQVTGLGTAIVGHVYVASTPYNNADWYNVKTTMVEGVMFMWHKAYPPQTLTLNGAPGSPTYLSSFTFSQPTFDNGPFFDPVPGQTVQISALTGTVGVILTGGFGPNQSIPTSADVGRLVRIFNEPPQWDQSTAYGAGAIVSAPAVNGAGNSYFYATVASTGDDPPLAPQVWAENPELAAWIWGTIVTIEDATTIQVTLAIDALYDASNYTWELGVFGDAVYGYPACGCFHEGRLWLFGGTRVDGSYAAYPFTVMDPTLIDGTVTDSSGISYTLEAGDDSSSTILWAISTGPGIVLGTNGGEWLIQASSLNDPITPTSIQAHRVTKYRCSYVKPVQTPLSIVFVQRFQRKVMEFLQDVFTGRYVAPNLTTQAKHLTQAGIEEVVYNEEITPILWMRDLNGNLSGITYRRQSSFPSEEPLFTGWHRHVHGEGRVFHSLSMSPSGANPLLDSLYVVDSLDTSSAYRIQRLTKQFDVDDAFASGFFLDSGVVPVAMVDVGTGVTLYGLSAHADTIVTVTLGGVNMGTFTPDSNGIVTVPYTSTVTATYLQSLDAEALGDAASTVTFSTGGGPITQPNTIAALTNTFIPSGGGSGIAFSIATAMGSGYVSCMTGSGPASSFEERCFEFRSGNLFTPAIVGSTTIDATFTGAQATYGYCFTYDLDLLMQMDDTQAALVGKYSVSGNVISTMGTSSDTPGASTDNVWLSSGFVACYSGANLVVTVGNSTVANAGLIQVINTDTMALCGGIASSTLAGMPTSCYCSTGYVYVDPPPIGGSAAPVWMMEHTSTTLTTLKLLNIAPSAATWKGSFAAWSSGTTYSIGQEVWYGNSAYTSNINSNTGNAPTGTDSTDWNVVNNPYISILTLGTITPAAVDATWTHLAIVDVGYDRTDGNLIVLVTTTDSVTNTQYLAKIDSADASVLWKTPIAYTNFTQQLVLSRIGNGVLNWTSDASSGTLYTINTYTGAVISTTNIAAAGFQISGYGQAASDSVNGTIIIPVVYNSGTSGAPAPQAGTPSTFSAWALEAVTYGSAPSLTQYNVPAIAGFDYSGSTQGQILRPGLPQDAGAANGPPQGKKRRVNSAAFLFQNTQAVSIGTNASDLKPIAFKTLGGTPYTILQLYDGVWWDQLNDDYSYDGMVMWQSTGPYPLTVVSVSGFLETQDI